MAQIKLVASDIDGTLLNSDKKISYRTIETVEKLKQMGVHVVLCSGRPVSGVMPHLKKLGLTDHDNYVITFNGAKSSNVTNTKVIKTHPLGYDDFVKFHDLAQRLGFGMQVVTLKSEIFTTSANISKYTVRDAFNTNMQIKYRPADLISPDIEIAKIMFVDDPTRISKLGGQLPKEILTDYYAVRTGSWSFEFMNKDASKGNALMDLCEYLGIDPAETMAIGDQNNDLTMLEKAGIGVAMANGNDLVKKTADVLTPSNDDDGVAQAMERYILK